MENEKRMNDMKIIRIILGKFLYFFFSKFPPSYARIKVGQKQLRKICGKLILEKCGKNVNIEKGARFSTKVQLGDNSGIGVNADLDGKVVIGANVMMGPNVTILTRNHEFSRTDIPMNQQGMSEMCPVTISDDVWIGMNVIILPGVRVSKGAIIGAGAVVTKNVPEYAVVAGNPAKIVKCRKQEANKNKI